MTDIHILTLEGKKKLEEELDFLKNVKRKEIVERIELSKEHGDLSENAEYHAARERQSFIAARIQDLQVKLGAAEVIDPATQQSDSVMFGATVRLLDVDTEEEKEYTLVGSEEADAARGYITINSPVARALISKEVGDTVRVVVPARTIEYEILDVRYGS